MRFVFKPVCLLILLSITTSFAVAAPASVKKISATSLEHGVRTEVSLSQPVKYHYFFLTNPNRLVVDLDDTKPITVAAPSFASAPWISHLRVAVHSPETQRLVFELTTATKAQLELVHSAENSIWHLNIDLQQPATLDTSTAAPKIIPQNAPAPPSPPSITKTADAHQAATRCINVVIDPGHGGSDPGATGLHGTKEKNVTLAISKDLYALINNTPGMCAYLTRDADYFVSLRGRLSVARKKSADIFVAIHADMFSNTTARGATVFALSQRGATSEAARWIAHNENIDDLLEVGQADNKDKDLQSILMDISQNETINRSLILGKNVLLNLDEVSKLHHVIVEQAGFVVLKSPDIPSILVETGFLSNAYEESQLTQSAYQQKIALAIYRGIVEYYKQYSPAGTKIKS